ncbi:MAG: cyclic nucleotide-binding domain-containing protein [Rhodospirillales bacterium]|nr:cyclic nucleotide-binding domain-containing protein [Rhodospirillales bacterium]MBO6788663.1 cyclic nucleotide-binding domain-containing protein [Rhodospirillales bacterium]
MAKNLTRKTYPPDALIFHEGDIANYAYLLKSGKVEITTYKGSKRIVLATILPNQLFGELALIDDSPRSASAIAVEASEVLVIRPEDIDKHLKEADDFMRYWVHYLTERVRILSKRVDD